LEPGSKVSFVVGVVISGAFDFDPDNSSNCCPDGEDGCDAATRSPSKSGGETRPDLLLGMRIPLA
jgi:hypothetical protein